MGCRCCMLICTLQGTKLQSNKVRTKSSSVTLPNEIPRGTVLGGSFKRHIKIYTTERRTHNSRLSFFVPDPPPSWSPPVHRPWGIALSCQPAEPPPPLYQCIAGWGYSHGTPFRGACAPSRRAPPWVVGVAVNMNPVGSRGCGGRSCTERGGLCFVFACSTASPPPLPCFAGSCQRNWLA